MGKNKRDKHDKGKPSCFVEKNVLSELCNFSNPFTQNMITTSHRTCAINGQWGLMGINNVPLNLTRGLKEWPLEGRCRESKFRVR